MPSSHKTKTAKPPKKQARNRRKPIPNQEKGQFKPGQSGNPNGRPPKLIHHIVEELRQKGFEPVKESQIVDAYQMLLQLPRGGVIAIQKDESKPYFLRLVAEWMHSARGMEMLDRIMDRSFGKVLQRQFVEANIVTEQPLFSEEKK